MGYRNRYTIKQLETLSDYELLELIVAERRSDVTNIYSPMNKRLMHLQGKLERHEPLTR